MIIPRGGDATRSYNPHLYPGTLHLFINVEKKYFVDLILRHLLSDRVSNSLHHVLCSRVNCEPRTWTHSRLAVKGFTRFFSHLEIKTTFPLFFSNIPGRKALQK